MDSFIQTFIFTAFGESPLQWLCSTNLPTKSWWSAAKLCCCSCLRMGLYRTKYVYWMNTFKKFPNKNVLFEYFIRGCKIKKFSYYKPVIQEILFSFRFGGGLAITESYLTASQQWFVWFVVIKTYRFSKYCVKKYDVRWILCRVQRCLQCKSVYGMVYVHRSRTFKKCLNQRKSNAVL